MTNQNEDTQPNTIKHRAAAALRTANAAADPVIDRLLLHVVASGWSLGIVLAYTLALTGAGIWIGASA